MSLGLQVVGAAAADLDLDGRIDLVVQPLAGGLAVFRAVACGLLEPGATALSGQLTGLALGDLDGAGGADVAALDESRVLHALSGPDLAPLWSATLTDLATPGRILAPHLDTDVDADVVAFDATFANLLRVENTGAGWMVRAVVALPPGITNTAAGDVGGNTRDEILFMGMGLVEVVSVADFDYSDIRFLDAAPHAGAAFVDFDDDGDGDAVVGTGTAGTVEVWDGDGTTALILGDFFDAGATVERLVPFQDVASPGVEVAAFDDLGRATVLRAGVAGPPEIATQLTLGPDLIHGAAGDLDGDGRDDLVAVATDGTVYVWRSP